MKTLAFAILLAIPTPLAFGAEKTPSAPPAYDVAKVITTTAIVTDVRENPKGDPLEGINLTVKAKGETFDVYVAPTAYLKMFDVTFKNGQELEITGSKVSAGLLLAREITLGRVAIVLRDPNGNPFWLVFTLPTGD